MALIPPWPQVFASAALSVSEKPVLTFSDEDQGSKKTDRKFQVKD